MSKYFELVEGSFTQEHFDKQNEYPYVAYSVNEDRVIYSKIEYNEQESYLTFTALEDNSSVGLEFLSAPQTIEYSYDKLSWTNMDTTTIINLNTNNKVYLRGILRGDNNVWENEYTQFKMTGKIAASGNCNSIWNYQDLNAPLKVGCGYNMFCKCTSLTTVPELPATELAEGVYYYMFAGCSQLVEAQKSLPALSLTKGWEYNLMFCKCTSLITAPELPATVLSEGCYEYMFWDCTSLTTAPEILPATELTNRCYYGMFYGCADLTTAPELPATILASECYGGMFYGCADLTTAPELPATTLANDCYNGMFRGCTSLTTTPELPATTLAQHCYRSMFAECTSLNSAPELPATELADWCYHSMFQGCTSLTTAPVLKSPELVDRGYLQMFYGCTSLNSITCLAEGDIQYSKATENWVYNVSPIGTFYKHPNSTWVTGTSGIPSGWTVLDAEI